MKVSTPSGSGDVHSSAMEGAGTRAGGLESSALRAVPSPEGECCIYLRFVWAARYRAGACPAQTNEPKVACRRE